MPYDICYWGFFLSQGNQFTKCFENACWCLRLWSPWTAFTCCCPLSWMLIWLRSEVVDLCYIHCHIFKQELLFIASKQLQTMLWVVDALLFFIDCEQTLHPLSAQLSHWQMFLQNGEYTTFWYLQLLCYLTQLQFMISQNEFVEFFGIFWDNYRIRATWAFSNICVSTTAFKICIPPLNHCLRLYLVGITLLLYLNFFFHQKAMLYQHTKFRFFSLFWKFSTVTSLK